MIFPTLMIEKNFLYPEEIHNYSCISNKLSFDVTTVSLVLTLSYFSLLDIDLVCLGNWPPPVLIHVEKKKKVSTSNDQP